MWPMLLNLTRDECRRTLRRLELEAYSNVISVFRAQGPLEDNRKKLLEELRAVLHISNDRHCAEARRVSNDELLATIADQLAGPNTGLAWISEGRRRVPLLPRGVAQTMYTELANQAAEAAAAENKELLMKLEAEELVAPKTEEEELPDAEGQTAESSAMDESLYPPVAMEDQATKLWETQLITPSRKRKVTEGSIPEDASTPIKSKRNIPVNTNQKHLNLSQIYSKFCQPATSKPSGQSKHSYNQVSKVSTSKSSQAHAPHSTAHKPRQKRAKNTNPIVVSKSQVKKPHEIPISPSKFNPADYPPNTFQGSYAQAVLGAKLSYDDIKPTPPGMVTESPTMQLLTQPATVPHEIGVSENNHPEDHSSLQAQTPIKQSVSGKPCHLIIKNRGELDTKDGNVVQKSSEGIKLLSSRHVVVAPSATQKALKSKLVPTKVISSVQKSRPPTTQIIRDKMIVLPKPASEKKPPSNSKIIISSSAITAPNKVSTPITSHPNSAPPITTETLTPKGIPAPDLKVSSAKAVVLNPKSGPKMVVLPAKPRPKPGPDGQIPVLPFNFKGIPTSMKLIPVSSHPMTPMAKSSTVTVVSKPNIVTPKKIVAVEPIKTANLADIVPAKGMTPVTATKLTNPIVRPINTKGNVIVVQKGATLGKALTFSKNSNDMSKIIMGKNVNQLLQAKPEQAEASKCGGNVIVLELNNEQSGHSTTMSEILDSRTTHTDDKKAPQEITQDTPVLFAAQITEETCNANSLDSTAESIGDIVPMEESNLPIMDKANKSFSKDSEAGKDSSSVTDWEIELDTVSTGKDKDADDKLNSLHLDLGMSSDSENEYMVDRRTTKKHTKGTLQATPSGESSVYSSSSGMSLATRTLLSQLQDDGSSSNDSSFALKTKTEKLKDSKVDKCELTDELTKAKEKLSEKIAEGNSRQKRIDIYSTAITPSDIHLESFSYLDEGMMADDDSADEGKRSTAALDAQLSRLLGDDSANSTDSQTKKQITDPKRKKKRMTIGGLIAK